MKKSLKIKPWKQVNSNVIFNHQRILLIEDEVELPNGVITTYLKFGDTGDAVTILCVKGEMILLQQEYSYPVGDSVYQFPGGKIEEGEDIGEAAIRELFEESGIQAQNVEYLGWCYSFNRRTDSKMHVVLVDRFEEGFEIEGDPEEFIVSEWVPIAELDEMIRNDEIVNFSVLSALSIWRAKKGIN